MYTCYIIDDELHCIDGLKKYIEKTPELILLKAFQNPLLALTELRKGEEPDFIFLDIDMPELSGLAFADLISKNIQIIFTTGHTKYAIDGFEKEAVDFLLKPYSFEKFLKAVSRVKARKVVALPSKNHELKSIFINPGVKGKVVQIFLTDLICIEAKDHFIGINTRTETIHSKMSLTEFMEKLTQENFIKVHRSFIINIDFIKSIAHNEILLNTNLLIPLSVTYKTELLTRIKHRTIKAL